MYRLRITYTYSSSAIATTAITAINNVLAGWADPVLSQRAVRTNAQVELKISGLTQAQATALHAALNSAVFSGTRTAGKYSLVRTPDVS